MKSLRAALVFVLLCAPLFELLGHPGGLDSNGGHNDRKNGGYHYHRAPSAAPPRPAPLQQPAPIRSPAPHSAKPLPSASASAETTAVEKPAEPKQVEAGWVVARVVAIHDGDTVSVLTDSKIMMKIRVHGIDAPESKQAFGNVAKSRAAALVMGTMVAFNPASKDRYGRTVSKITLPDGSDFGKIMIREGLAWHYLQYAKDEPEYAKAEAFARETKRGLWSEGTQTPPWEWRNNSREVKTPTEDVR
jgi:micrococcal nuclease